MINIFSSSRYKLNRKLIKKEGTDILKEYSIPENALFNLVFIGKKKMKQIAAKYKNENIALPVLSFSYGSQQSPGVDGSIKHLVREKVEQTPLGEVFVCYPQAILLAAERQKKVDDMMVSLIRHGLENILK